MGHELDKSPPSITMAIMIPTGNTCAEPLKSCKLYGSANAQITLGLCKISPKKI